MNNVFKNALLGFSRQEAAEVGYQVPQSLRFNSADSAYLSWTPAQVGNRKTWTWSGWVKRSYPDGITNSQNRLLFSAQSGTPWFQFGFEFFDGGTGNIDITFSAGVSAGTSTNAIFRDFSAWYHIVLAVDTTQATAADRLKLYVNGVEQTFRRTNYPAQNFDTQVNSIIPHYIGRANSASYFNGYLTEVNFIDGLALAASDFGETDTTTGVWKPKEYTGSYGANGFYLPFNDNSSVSNLGLSKIAYTSDQGWNRTSLLLNTNGVDADQNNTFLDSSTNNFTITRNGNTTQGRFSPFADGWSNYFDGTGDYLQLASNAAFNMNTYCCLEAWVNYSTLGSNTLISGRDASYWIAYNFTALDGLANKFVFSIYNGSAWHGVSSTTTPVANRWYHVVGVREDGTLKIYIDGVLENTDTFSGTPNNGTVYGIGANQNTQNMAGYVSNNRLVLGSDSSVLPYTSNFTPPTTPLTAVSGTSLLTCQSNRFVDNSTNNFAVTRYGDTKVTAFNPFTPTQAYSASVNGGSGYFDGTGDYLGTTTDSSALTFGTGDFTIESWVYSFDVTNDKGICQISDTSGGLKATASGVISITTRFGVVRIVNAGTATAGTIAVRTNEWFHFALVRSSGVTNLYINGVKDTGFGDKNDTTNYNTKYAAVGGYETSSYLYNGIFSGFRIVKGTAIDYSSVGIPTAPPTAVSGTELLLNFTNAGIVDASGKNNIETVGDAQVDTAVTKWGSSVKFDGTGDWLQAPISDITDVANGDFTIEAWIYPTATTGGTRTIVSTYTNGYIFYIRSADGKLQFDKYGVSTPVTGATAISINTWTHVAVTRSGNTFRIFINGTQDASGTAATTFSNTSPQRIGDSGSGSQTFSGYIEDLRITKGLARYTGSFTVPNAAFAYDKSDINYKQWVPNNFSVTAGVGNDSLVDTPTPYGTDTGVGGEVRGNYATLNPLVQSYGSGIGTAPLSNGNLVATSNASSQACFSTIPITSGKWYFEATLSNLAGSSNVTFIGLAPIPNYVQSLFRAYAHDGTYFNGTSWSAYGASYTTNDIISCAVDLDSDTVEFFKNGVSQGQKTSIGLSGNGTYYLYGYLWVSGSIWTFNFGQRPFAYTAPSGFKALCTQNLPTPTVKDGSDYFNTVLYTGTGTTSQDITTGFAPDFVWIKNRQNAYWNELFDTIRGVNKPLYSNATNAEASYTSLPAFLSDGFTVQDNGTTNKGTNTPGESLVAWAWNAGGSNATNTDGTITSTVRANPTAGFSIVSWTASGADATIGHGLGSTPSMIIAKRRDSTGNWAVQFPSIGNGYLLLNSTQSYNGADPSVWNATAPTSTVFSTAGQSSEFFNAGTFISYCFAEVEGFSKALSWTGNGSSDGVFLYCGFRPAYILIKRTNTTEEWVIVDTTRDSYNLANKYLLASSSGAEGTTTLYDFLSNGIKMRGNSQNESGSSYIGFAFAETPFKYSLAR